MTFTQEIEQHNKLIKDLKAENRLLGERCNQLLKDKGDLTDKIADIKANCDFAIEGRDVKIMELEKENAELKNKLTEKVTLESLDVVSAKMNDLEKENAELKHNKKTVVHLADCLEEKMKERIEALEKEIAELKIHHKKVCEVLTDTHRDLGEQIEKMKCCENCKHHYKAEDNDTYCYKCIVDEISLWELKE